MRPRVYLASPLGFTEPGRLWASQVLVPRVAAAGFEPVDPWSKPESEQSGGETTDEGNRAIGRANEAALRSSVAMLALLDGTEVDSGTAAELGFAAAIGLTIVGLRTDFRIAADNPAARTNVQLEYWIEQSGGDIVTSLADAVVLLTALVG